MPCDSFRDHRSLPQLPSSFDRKRQDSHLERRMGQRHGVRQHCHLQGPLQRRSPSNLLFLSFGAWVWPGNALREVWWALKRSKNDGRPKLWSNLQHFSRFRTFLRTQTWGTLTHSSASWYGYRIAARKCCVSDWGGLPAQSQRRIWNGIPGVSKGRPMRWNFPVAALRHDLLPHQTRIVWWCSPAAWIPSWDKRVARQELWACLPGGIAWVANERQ